MTRPDVCNSGAYKVLKTIQMHAVFSAAYVHFKKIILKYCEKSNFNIFYCYKYLLAMVINIHRHVNLQWIDWA